MEYHEKFIRHMADACGVRRDSRLLLGVSGGVDSMVMLDLFVRGGCGVEVAHCNFNLRGAESDGDQELVREVCARLGVVCHVASFDTYGESARAGESVEMAARRLRYDWFERVRAGRGLDWIAVAHHIDDSVETFFINLVRGTSLRGLTGIHAVRGRVVRPMLFSTRHEIEQYARKNDVGYRHDSTNGSDEFLRNKIRLHVLPGLKKASPAFLEVMRHSMQNLSQVQAFVDHSLGKITDRIKTERPGRTEIDWTGLAADPDRGFAVYEMVRGYGFTATAAEGMCRALENGLSGRVFEARGFRAAVDRGRIIIEPEKTERPTGVDIVSPDGTIVFDGALFSFTVVGAFDEALARNDRRTAFFPLHQLVFPLTLRPWDEGDRMMPFGMDGTKKVSDCLVDMKVPLPDKHRVAVLVSGGDIVWLCGLRTDNRYRVCGARGPLLKVVMEPVE